MVQVGALKVHTEALDIDALEDAQDDLEEMMGEVEEVNEVMGSSFAMGDEIDEAELDAELAALGTEFEEVPYADEFAGIATGPVSTGIPAGMPAVPASASASSVPARADGMPAVPAAMATTADPYGGVI